MAKLTHVSGISHGVSRTITTTRRTSTSNIRREQAKINGVSEARILALLRNAYSQNYLYLIKKPADQYQVILEAQDSARETSEDLSLLYIRSDDGKRLVPLNALVTWKSTLGPQAVNHLNQFTSVTLYFNLKPGVAIGDATDFITQAAAEVVPPTLRAELQGEALTFQRHGPRPDDPDGAGGVRHVRDPGDSLRELSPSADRALDVAYGLVGGLATLYLFGEQASLYAFVGMFMLMGIVKKNGIMIVDFALQRVDAGEAAEKAIHDASMDRFRPILMTTLAAVFGAMPIALGFGADGASRRPLGLVIVGGLIVSQFITLFITPVIYLYLEEFQEKVLDRTSFFRSEHGRRQAKLDSQP